jgi:hypothetical protein
MSDLVKRGPLFVAEQVPGSGLGSEVAAILDAAETLGSRMEFLGVYPLFDEVRVYRGQGRDWVLAPAQLDSIFQGYRGHFPTPVRELERLERFVAGRLNFPVVFIAHDVEPGMAVIADNEPTRLPILELVPATRGRVIAPAVAREVVPVPNPPERTLEWSRRYGEWCRIIMRTFTLVAATAGAIVVAPIALAGVALEGGAVSDPILFGAIPLDGPPAVGRPAMWFVLAKWSY